MRLRLLTRVTKVRFINFWCLNANDVIGFGVLALRAARALAIPRRPVLASHSACLYYVSTYRIAEIPSSINTHNR
jgi:hypothetical protein